MQRAPVWVRTVDAHADVAALRVDAYRNVTALVWVLAAAARPDATSAPTWEVLTARTGLSRRAVARWLVWLRVRGLLLVAETGSTPATRSPLDATEGNRAAVYVLTAPPSSEHRAEHDPEAVEEAAAKATTPVRGQVLPAPQAGQDAAAPQYPHLPLPRPLSLAIAGVGGDESGTPPISPLGEIPTRARDARESLRTTAPSRAAAGQNPDRGGVSPELGAPAQEPAQDPGEDLERKTAPVVWADSATARTRREELAAAAALRRRSVELRGVSERAVRAAVRDFLRAGWSVDDLAYALDHAPDGSARTWTSSVRQPVAWARARLAPWAGKPGPVSTRRATSAATAAQLREQLRARRAAHAAAVAAAVPAPAELAAVRAALAARRGARRPTAAHPTAHFAAVGAS